MALEFNAARDVVTISTDERFAASLRYILKRLESFIKTGVISARILKNGARNELIIAINALDEAKVKKIASTVIDSIAEVVITDCKSYYIESSLKLPIDDEISRHAFIRALSSFDSETDKMIAKSLIKLTPSFLLDSFYQFMIDDLKVRWNEVCGLANENACYLVCAGTFRELLRFLISNLESRASEVHLFKRKNGIEVLNGGLKPINNIYINEDLPADIQVVSKLISVAPKKIFIHDNDQTPLISFIQNLFGGCVQVVQN